MSNETRRKFLKQGGMLLASGALGSIASSASAAEHDDHAQHGGHLKSMKGIDAFVVDAKEEGICATCRFWGGVRRATEDKKYVHCESLGWCNNPDSHHYQTKTTPVTGPMESWKKWEAL
jgi:hypothetical protein